MFSAARRPDLFSRVVLLDPVLLPRKYVLLIRFMKLFRKKDRFPLAIRARRRRNGWQSREEALAYFRNKELFNGWEEEFLMAYVTYGLRPEPDGRVVLVCPPEAEARGFENYPVDVWSWPKLLKTPALIVRGENSDALTQKCYEKFCGLCPSAKGVVMQGAGHFVPMQNSAETKHLIKDFCPVSP
jgi:pimeloyl-ACP methyl ester carboxylesterase